jgi:hypothetical protein
MKKYYYNDGQQNHGPFTLEELAQKNLSRETLVWYPELETWQPAGNASEIAPILPAVKAVPPKPVAEMAPAPPRANVQPAAPSFDLSSLGTIVGKTFSDPEKGIASIIAKPPKGSGSAAVFLFVLAIVVSLAAGLIMAGKFGLMNFVQPASAMLIITILLFLVKAISGKPNLANEFLTGAICGIPYILLTLFILLASEVREINTRTAIQIAIGIVFLLKANIIRQSIEGAGAGKALSWYFSIIVMFLAYFLSAEVQNLLARAVY